MRYLLAVLAAATIAACALPTTAAAPPAPLIPKVVAQSTPFGPIPQPTLPAPGTPPPANTPGPNVKGADVKAPDVGPTSAALNALNASVSLDIGNGQSTCEAEVTSIGSMTLAFQQLINSVPVPIVGMGTLGFTSANGSYYGSCAGGTFRVTVSSYVSGSTNVVIRASRASLGFAPAQSSAGGVTPIICQTAIAVSASGTSAVNLASFVTGARVYVCGWDLTLTGTSPTMKLQKSASNSCTSPTDLTGPFTPTAGSPLVEPSIYWRGIATDASGALCLQLGGTGPGAQGVIHVAQFAGGP